MKWKPDVVYLLRVQMERLEAQYFPSLREYHRVYGVTEERFRRIADQGTYIMQNLFKLVAVIRVVRHHKAPNHRHQQRFNMNLKRQVSM